MASYIVCTISQLSTNEEGYGQPIHNTDVWVENCETSTKELHTNTTTQVLLLPIRHVMYTVIDPKRNPHALLKSMVLPHKATNNSGFYALEQSRNRKTTVKQLVINGNCYRWWSVALAMWQHPWETTLWRLDVVHCKLPHACMSVHAATSDH